MSEFNKVIIGKSPYDPESIIAWFKENPKNGITELKGTGGSIKLGMDDGNHVSGNLLGEVSAANAIQDQNNN
jgi:hypothetical protein